MTSDGALSVFLDNQPVGRLWLNRYGLFCFQYAESWIASSQVRLSLSLPLQKESFENNEAHPFFANLLPDGELREAVARRLHISAANDYGMLERIGGDCAGAVTLLPGQTAPLSQESYYEPTDDEGLKRLIQELPKRPLLAGEKGIRLSLAGAQQKLPVYYDGETFCIAHGEAPSTHIIKPQMRNLDDTVVNEAFCMKLARHLGLPVPRCFIQTIGEIRFFVVQRYDRHVEGNRVYRLHQEDFCQALGVLPRFKYESEGGPSFKECYDTVRTASGRPGRETLLLLKWLIFNYLIGNCDNHAKNISLIHLPNRPPLLAPFYDLISTTIYAHYGVSDTLAMKIGGESDPERIRRKHWILLAEELGVKPQLLFDLIVAMATALPERTIAMRQGEFKEYECDALFRLVQAINLRAGKSLKGLVP